MLLPNDIESAEDWKVEVMNHPNQLCRDTQRQIGKVEHLIPHLTECSESARGFRTKGLNFGENTDCYSFHEMCADARPYVSKTCPPLSRVINSNYFCKNTTYFKDIDVRPMEFFLRCTGNAPTECFLPSLKCSGLTIGTCSDNSNYICPLENEVLTYTKAQIKWFSQFTANLELARTIVNANRHNFTMCRDKGHFVCRDGKKCIHKTLKCDGYNQCDDGSDEDETQCAICP